MAANVPMNGEHGWIAFGEKLRTVRDGLQWCVGDWLNYGEDTYGEEHAQGVDAEHWEPRTICNYANVCRAFPYARRRATLPFSHHAAVYTLPQKDQERLLDHAERECWSEKTLRKAARGAKAGKLHQKTVDWIERVVLIHPEHKKEVSDVLDGLREKGWVR